MDNIKVLRENHFDELMTSLKCFASAGIITDLALVTGGEPLHVHHLILSCFSTCFEYLAENDRTKYLVHTDQRKTVLEALIDYIYKGIAHIPQVYKKQFVMAATSLHMRDFSSINDDFDHLSNKEQATIVCPNHKVQLSQKIWNARQISSKSDVIFIINNKERLFAHACILSACSSHLLQIFTEHCTEKKKPYIVALRNVKKTDLELVIRFCYKGEVRVPFCDVQSVFNLADLLGIETLCNLLNNDRSANVQTVPVKTKGKYSTNIIRTSGKPTALADLLRFERLVDVFIITKQKIFKAHSVILSIYSVFFKELANFLNYDMKDVIILIENVNTCHIETLLEYLYIGEATFEGNTETFCEIMSEWIDLNILPVSSDVAPPVFSSIQSFTEDYECKIKYAVNSEKLPITTKNERRAKNEKIKENTGCKDNLEKERFINNVIEPIFLKQETEDEYNVSREKEMQKLDKTERLNTLLVINDIVDCDRSVPEPIVVKENNCERISHFNNFYHATKTLSDKLSHENAEMKDKMSRIECAGSLENKSTEMDVIIKKKVSSSVRRQNQKNKTHSQLVTRAKIKMETSKQCNGSVNKKSEGFVPDDPEGQKPINISKADELNDLVTNTKTKCKRVFECQICNEKFPARWEFKLHLSEHPRGNILQCKFCQKEFSRPSELQSHLRSHTGARPLQCETCGLSFMSKNTLRKHEHIHLRNKSNEFECEVCKKTFSRKQYLHEHRRTHTGSKPYECDVCHKRFVGKTGLNHHKKIHKNADEKKCAVCEICGESFTRHALWTHMKHHNKEYKCGYCNKCFATTGALKIHEAGTHLGNASQHHCNTCGKGFMRKSHLSRHLKTHEKENNITMHACGQCPSKFKDESHLKAHVKRKHTEQNNRSPTCGICGKRFSTQSTLIDHRRLHFHERPHRCNFCGKTFAMPYLLRDHTRIHHNEEKLFPCPVCKKKCATQSLLNRHLMTHRPTFTPEIKPPGSFICNYCDKSFPSKLALSNHSRSHNFSRPYQCNVCRKAFRYQDSLLKHLQIHPNNSTSETTKELPCIYTIQVCRPSFAPVSSEIIGNPNYIDRQNEMLSSETISNTVSDVPSNSVCLNIPEKTSNISLLQLKAVEETYLSQHILQDEVAYSHLQSIEANTLCDISVQKTSNLTALPQRPYSITIDGNLCCNNSLSTDGDITPSITLLPERAELDIPDVDVSVPSHVLLSSHSSSMVELTELAVSLPSEQTGNEFDSIAQNFSL